jgi:hypothetical protein
LFLPLPSTLLLLLLLFQSRLDGARELCVSIAIQEDLELSIQITSEPKGENKSLTRKKSFYTMRILESRGEHGDTTSFWFNNLFSQSIRFMNWSEGGDVRGIEEQSAYRSSP